MKNCLLKPSLKPLSKSHCHPGSLAGMLGFLDCLKIKFGLKAHCRGCDWLMMMLKSRTKLWPLSNYQDFLLSNHTLFPE